jgi:anti-sigma regulatory factor (Ser/Thr protein kinase)
LADLARQACESTAWEDDIQLVSGHPQWISLRVRCRLVVADRVVSILREMLCGVPRPACEDIVAAARELLMNAIEHGGQSNPALRVRISLVRGQRAVVCLIEDPGNGFSFDALTHAAIANPSGDPTHHIGIRSQHRQRPGGFGILMARNLVDEILYSEKGNQVLFVKYLP